MSSAPTPYAFRRRTVGRAASPPTWACYEQIPNDYSDSGSDSCSEDDESYDQDNSSDSEDHNQESQPSVPDNGHAAADVDSMDMDMDPAEAEAHHDPDSITPEPTITSSDKGKQRAIDPEPESPPSRRRHRRKNRHSYPLRPILTIHRSQGFVWNQDLFVPPYIKDRYVASTSPPNSTGFISTSVSSTNSALNDYEVEVVEIRVKEGELGHIIP